MKKLLTTTGILLLSLAMIGCSSNNNSSYTAAYRAALQDHQGVAIEGQSSVDAFLDVYDHLGGNDIDQYVERAYAQDLYFNDTLHTIRDRDTLKKYLMETGEKIDSIEVEVMSVMQDGPDVYVRWTMTTKFKVMGKDIDATSIGISHLRFDDQNRVILHQDFWDNTEGLFSHLPFIGGVVRWARGKT